MNRQLQSTNRQFGNKLTVSLCLHFQLKKKKVWLAWIFYLFILFLLNLSDRLSAWVSCLLLIHLSNVAMFPDLCIATYWVSHFYDNRNYGSNYQTKIQIVISCNDPVSDKSLCWNAGMVQTSFFPPESDVDISFWRCGTETKSKTAFIWHVDSFLIRIIIR